MKSWLNGGYLLSPSRSVSPDDCAFEAEDACEAAFPAELIVTVSCGVADLPVVLSGPAVCAAGAA